MGHRLQRWGKDWIISALVSFLFLIFFLFAGVTSGWSGQYQALQHTSILAAVMAMEGSKEAPSAASSTTASLNKDNLTEKEAKESGKVEEIPDPLERWNRWMFTFNDKFYFWVFKPVAKGYKKALPDGVRIAVKNFFQNVTMPVRLINALFQARPKVAVYELSRFIINSSVGLGGFADVASQEPELRLHDEDTGQTLGVYGVGHGFYIVWPILGPSSLRDTFGMVADGFMDPVNYLPLISVPRGAVVGIHAYDYLNRGSLTLGEYEDLKKSALDPYIAVRNAYYQRRKRQVEE